MATQARMTDAERMAIEDAKDPYWAGRTITPTKSNVSADARYVVQWMLGIFVLLPLLGVLIFVLLK